MTASRTLFSTLTRLRTQWLHGDQRAWARYTALTRQLTQRQAVRLPSTMPMIEGAVPIARPFAN